MLPKIDNQKYDIAFYDDCFYSSATAGFENLYEKYNKFIDALPKEDKADINPNVKHVIRASVEARQYDIKRIGEAVGVVMASISNFNEHVLKYVYFNKKDSTIEVVLKNEFVNRGINASEMVVIFSKVSEVLQTNYKVFLTVDFSSSNIVIFSSNMFYKGKKVELSLSISNFDITMNKESFNFFKKRGMVLVVEKSYLDKVTFINSSNSESIDDILKKYE